jgi:hypothetical protein
MGTSVFSTTPNSGVAIDQTVELLRIAVALETIAANSTTMVNALGSDSATISGMLSSLTQSLENIESHQKRVKELADGPGIRMIGPYEWVGLISSYQLLINQGEILNTESDVSPEKIAEAKAAVIAFIEKIRELPTLF